MANTKSILTTPILTITNRPTIWYLFGTCGNHKRGKRLGNVYRIDASNCVF
ncbi:Uncharacterised protein [Moraxella caviae]|nr:hypothetical protein [Moraxella caviae]VEW12983.1 Uncharacterised protein [Moraxella caviae]